MKTYSIINYKGGVGKTTLTLNIAAEIAFRGNKVLIIDLDPQASLTFSCISAGVWKQNLEASRNIKKWYDDFVDGDTNTSLSDLIYRPSNLRYHNGHVGLISSHLGLINVDLELAAKLTGTSPSQMGKNFLKVYSRLRHGLSEPEVQNNFDVVLIDCPPNFNIVTKTALVASHGYFVPAKPDYLSTLGIEQLNRHVNQLKTDYNFYQDSFGEQTYGPIEPLILGVIFTMVKMYNGYPIQDQQEHIAAMERIGIPVFEQKIRENNRFYSRRTDDKAPLVIQNHSDGTFQEIRSELENLTSEILMISSQI